MWVYMTVLNFMNQLIMLHCGKAIKLPHYFTAWEYYFYHFINPLHLVNLSTALSLLVSPTEPLCLFLQCSFLSFLSLTLSPLFPSFLYSCAHHFPSVFATSQRPHFLLQRKLSHLLPLSSSHLQIFFCQLPASVLHDQHMHAAPKSHFYHSSILLIQILFLFLNTSTCPT